MQVSKSLPAVSFTAQPLNKMVTLLLKWKYICEERTENSALRSLTFVALYTDCTSLAIRNSSNIHENIGNKF